VENDVQNESCTMSHSTVTPKCSVSGLENIDIQFLDIFGNTDDIVQYDGMCNEGYLFHNESIIKVSEVFNNTFTQEIDYIGLPYSNIINNSNLDINNIITVNEDSVLSEMCDGQIVPDEFDPRSELNESYSDENVVGRSGNQKKVLLEKLKKII